MEGLIGGKTAINAGYKGDIDGSRSMMGYQWDLDG